MKNASTPIERFKPAWWMRNRHLQTILPSRFRKVPSAPTRRYRLELDDGDFLDLDVLDSSRDEAPVLLLFHGLEGSADSQYIKAMLLQAKQQDWRAMATHFRGCSEEPNRLPRSYHSGETADLEHVIQYASTAYPHSPLVAVGYSLGGSALLNLLADNPNADKLAAACAVSVPYDLAASADVMNQGFARIYRNHFLKTLCEKAQNKARLYQEHHYDLDLVAAQSKQDFWVYDHYITAPLHGFDSVEDYYQRCSSGRKLHRITRPTLLVHALDDPFMHSGVVPQAKDLPSNIELEISKYGGHLGFVSGHIPLRPKYDWLEKRLMMFLEQQLNPTG